MTKTVEYTYQAAVSSDVLEHVYYNLNYRTLYVKFTNGRFAGYSDVPPMVVDNLVHASSVGRYYNSNIRGRYKGVDASNLTFKQASITPMQTGYVSTTPAKATQPYVVKGEVKQLVESNYAAANLDDAVKQFLADNPNATVTEVTVKF